MSKRSKSAKRKKKVIVSSSSVGQYLDLIQHDMMQGNYSEVVTNCERLLNYLPQNASQRVDVLGHLGTAHAMLQNFRKSYDVLSEALRLDPKIIAAYKATGEGWQSRINDILARELPKQKAKRQRSKAA